MELQQELERDIAHGPALPTPEQRLRAGRAALRRRRVAVGAAAAGVVVAAVAPFALGTGPATRGTDLVPASPGISDSPSAGVDLFEPRQGAPVDIDRQTRELVFAAGAVVQRRTDGVVQDIDGRSASLVIDFEGGTYWVVMAWDERRGDVAYDLADSNPDSTFDEFVARHLPKLERKYAVAGSTTQGDDLLTGPGSDSLALEVVDGFPEVAGAGTSIGPVLREGERGYGYEVDVTGTPSFVLIVTGDNDAWRVLRLDPVGPGEDLATWLRAAGWLPTGEEAGA